MIGEQSRIGEEWGRGEEGTEICERKECEKEAEGRIGRGREGDWRTKRKGWKVRET